MKKNRPLKELAKQEHMDLTRKLQYRFMAWEFITTCGVQWAGVAIDPSNNTCWEHDAYMASYNYPKA